MITILYSQLNLVNGIGDFTNVAIDTIVEVPDTDANKPLIGKIAKVASDRARELKGELACWTETYSARVLGPVVCFALQTKTSVAGFDRLLQEFLNADQTKPHTPIRNDAPDFAPVQGWGEDNYIINIKEDYAD